MYYKLWKNKFLNDLNIDLTSTYHLEGTVLAHTLMVYNEIQNSIIDLDFYKITALLHDIGKRRALQIIDNKKITQGHEGISTFMAVNYLKELVIEDIIDEEDLFDILFLINHHGDIWKYKDSKKYWKMWEYETHKLDWIKVFNKYDRLGSISDIEFTQPEIEVKAKKMNKAQEGKPVVYFMMGIPNSGKTTFIENNLKDKEIVSRDNILLEYGKEKYNLEDYSDIWKVLTDEDQKEIDKLLNERLKDLQEQGKDFVIDMTLLNVKSRRRMLNKIKKDYQVIYINILTDYETIMERNKERFEKEGKLIPENVIINMMKKYQFPLYGEDDRIVEIYNILG